MLIGDLSDYVLNFERGQGEEMPIWVSVPGSFLSGTLVSHRHLVRKISEFMMENASITDQALLSIHTDLLDERESEYCKSISKVSSAHLVNVNIFQGNKIFRSPLAVIDLASVGAWGLGEFQVENTSKENCGEG
jgi:hypothetical protein